jgi:hypothetical protein
VPRQPWKSNLKPHTLKGCVGKRSHLLQMGPGIVCVFGNPFGVIARSAHRRPGEHHRLGKELSMSRVEGGCSHPSNASLTPVQGDLRWFVATTLFF